MLSAMRQILLFDPSLQMVTFTKAVAGMLREVFGGGKGPFQTLNK